MTSARAADQRALLLACPTADVETAEQAQRTHGLVLLPAGAVGDLAGCDLTTPLYLLAIEESGVAPAATWHARLVGSVSLVSPEPGDLLPRSWKSRHPEAYLAARNPARSTARALEDDQYHDDYDEDDEDDDDGNPAPQQVFIPVTDLVRLPRSQWLFTNELVPKKDRGGRRFAPRYPTLVTLPD